MPSHLVLVACHAVYTATDFHRVEDDSAWCLEDFQRGEPQFYLSHIRRGVELAASDSSSLLVFSGGQTRHQAGPRSEALSYWLLADYFGWWGQDGVRERATTEEFARDSLENLLFGICRFREWTSTYPQHISLISWGFKQKRFEMHRRALRIPSDAFAFIGDQNPPDLDRVLKGEERNAVIPFSQDPYGSGDFLAAKRVARNPFRRSHGYAASCRQLAALLHHHGPNQFAEPLPWDPRKLDS